MQLGLSINKKAPVAVAWLDELMVTCPANVTLQPFGAAGTFAAIAPDSDTVPDSVLVDPDIFPPVPVITPLDSAIVSEWEPLEPSDWSPLQLPE